MEIRLYFKELLLGVLTMTCGEYVYNSNIDGERDFKKYATSFLYGLHLSNYLKSKVLFDEFSEIVKNVRARADIMNEAHILQDDSDFVVLQKYGTLPQCQDKYWIEVCE